MVLSFSQKTRNCGLNFPNTFRQQFSNHDECDVILAKLVFNNKIQYGRGANEKFPLYSAFFDILRQSDNNY